MRGQTGFFDIDERLLAAIDAGKHVYCEWPLGRNTDEGTVNLFGARVTRRLGGIKLRVKS
jgi:hypothetical protein